MKPGDFLQQIDDGQVVAAIADSERATSGEIRIFISHRKRKDALTAAQKRFDKLGMRNTKHRNAVLIYIVPRTRSFAIVGDAGIHEKCGESFWKETAGEFGENLRKLTLTEALVRVVQKTGNLLEQHFPADPDNRNELPDEILHD
ncbi:MAG: TPM domain-containing protein [Verrucomicrobiota bacterium]